MTRDIVHGLIAGYFFNTLVVFSVIAILAFRGKLDDSPLGESFVVALFVSLFWFPVGIAWFISKRIEKFL